MNHKGSKELTRRLKASQRKIRLIRDELVNSEDGKIDIPNVVQRLAEAMAEAERQALGDELQQENQQETIIGEDLMEHVQSDVIRVGYK